MTLFKWLVEFKDFTVNAAYVAEGSMPGDWYSTSDANVAMHFATKEEADAYIASEPALARQTHAVEHGFIA